MVSIRFYTVDPSCWFSRLVCFFGAFKHDMTLTHVSIEWDGFVSDFTIDGLGYYSVIEEEAVREPVCIVYVEADTGILYERLQSISWFSPKLKIISIVKKMFKLSMNLDDLLCTDFVQIILGEEPLHLTPVEYMKRLTPVTVETLPISEK